MKKILIRIITLLFAVSIPVFLFTGCSSYSGNYTVLQDDVKYDISISSKQIVLTRVLKEANISANMISELGMGNSDVKIYTALRYIGEYTASDTEGEIDANFRKVQIGVIAEGNDAENLRKVFKDYYEKGAPDLSDDDKQNAQQMLVLRMIGNGEFIDGGEYYRINNGDRIAAPSSPIRSKIRLDSENHTAEILMFYQDSFYFDNDNEVKVEFNYPNSATYYVTNKRSGEAYSLEAVYDDMGRLVKKTYFTEDGQMEHSTQTTYYDNGNKETERFDRNPEFVEFPTANVTVITEYYENGKKKQEKLYTANGFYDEYHYEYWENGNEKTVTRFYEDYVEEWFTSEDGNRRTEKRSYSNGTPISYEVYDNGNLIISEHYN